jgi:Domain of unknown function (DUF4148)
MNTTRTLTASVLLATLIGSAFADGGLTREEVRAQLLEAQRNGDVRDPIHGLKHNEIYPWLYAPKPAVAGKTRAEVKAEFAEARRNGDITVGERGLKLRDLYPAMYPAQPQVAGKTRAEVLAELAEAQLLGDMVVGEDGRTWAETFPERYAAVRAQHAARARQLAEQQAALQGGRR